MPFRWTRSRRYAEQDLILPAEESERLRIFARQQRVTMNTLVQGAWALLLQQYSGADDVVFGTTVSGRPPELDHSETMVGLFINTLPVRVAMPAGANVAAWLQTLQQQQSEGRQYEYTPLTKIQGWSEMLPGQALFDTLVVFENFPTQDAADGPAPSLRIRNLSLREPAEGFWLTPGRNNYPLTLVAEPGPTMRVTLCYARSRYAHALIARLLEQYRRLLEWMYTQPSARLCEASILSPEEKSMMLDRWNAPTSAEAEQQISDKPLHTFFEAQAIAHPERMAVVYESNRMTYAELNAQANRVAQALMRRGVRPGSRVGVCLERSVELVIGILGILKAGAAYVPVEPTLPGDRLTFLFRDAEVVGALTQASVRKAFSAETLGALKPLALWDIDRLLNEGRSDSEASLPSLHPDSLAYLIYTSGSTGQPKGVGVSHRAIGTYIQNVLARIDAPAEATQWAWLSTVAADLGHTMLFGALCSGRTLHVLATDRGFHPEQMAAYMHRERIDVLKLTPSHLAGLLDATEPAQVLPRHTLLLGGEALNRPLVERIQQLAPACAIINHYGPTETTVGILTHRISDRAEQISATVPVGRPLAQGRAYILDRRGEPVALEVAGELYLGGAGLAEGYYRQPSLTAERFIPHPFSQEPGARLYRTGDRARYRPDGTIEFLGRQDRQVKLRGYRIELEKSKHNFARSRTFAKG